MRILIVEDDPVLSDGLVRSLKSADYAVDSAIDGSEADHILSAGSYDLVILDLGLPRLDGYEVLRRLRRRGSKTPVLILTALDSLEDRVKGLDLGADDYLTKPFDLPELEARVRALIRRGQSGGGSLLSHGALTLDTAGRRALLAGEPLELSARDAIHLRFPTRKTLERFAACSTTAELMAQVSSSREVSTLMPRVTRDGRYLIPGDSGYEDASEEES